MKVMKKYWQTHRSATTYIVPPETRDKGLWEDAQVLPYLDSSSNISRGFSVSSSVLFFTS